MRVSAAPTAISTQSDMPPMRRPTDGSAAVAASGTSVLNKASDTFGAPPMRRPQWTQFRVPKAKLAWQW